MALNELSNLHREIHDRFAEYLDGKSVAILGRGPSLQCCDRGTVESYDVVVRVHRPAPVEAWWPPPLVQPEWQERVGSRTDIFYTSIGEVTEDFMERVVTAFQKEGGTFLCRPHPVYALASQKWCMLTETFMQVRYVDIGLYFDLMKGIDFTDTFKLTHRLGATPFPGTLAVADILSHNVKEAFIGGMTCYCDRSDVGIIESTRISKCDFNYLRSLREQHPDKIKVDPQMDKLFKTVDYTIPAEAPAANELYTHDHEGSVNDYIA